MGKQSKYIVGLGELLFDFIDDQPVLGGAPVNFAIQAHQILNAHGFQGAAAVRLGNDDLAERAVSSLRRFGLATQYIQHDPLRATGKAIVHRVEDGHQFEIVENACWDYYQWDDLLDKLCKNTAVVCFGTLGQRSPQSRETIRRFVETATHAIRVFDVNIRQHYFDADTILHGCEHADILKLNHEEVPLVATSLGLANQDDTLEICRTIRSDFNLRFLVYTQGDLGTTVITKEAIISGSPINFPPAKNADSVGAGDACTAGIIAGTILKFSLEETVKLANKLGAFVASQHGATPVLPELLLP